MRCRLSIAFLGLACFFSIATHASAQAKLAGAVREEPSPTIVSIKGAGTANAVAEARMTAQTLKEHCQEHAGLYASAATCLKQMQTDFGSKTFRATADCTAGRITTSAELSYTLDGVWESSSDGAGRTRWRDSDKKIVSPDLFGNGLYVSQQWETLCPGPVTPALIARAKGQPAAAAAAQAPRGTAPAQAARGTAPATAQRTPSLCAGQPGCDDVGGFAARITDFRTSQYDQNNKVVSATIRFVNKTNRTLVLGYVRNAAVAINEAGNRYTVVSPDNVRGIGEIAGGQFDPKFSLAPGQAADTRFEFSWRWNGSEIIGQRTWDMDLTVREVNEVAPGQYRFGQEHALQLKGLTPANATSTSPAGGAISGVPGGTAVPRGAAPAPAPAPAATAAVPAAQAAVPAATAAVPAAQADACAGLKRCYDVGPFVAEIVQVTPSITKATYNWHVMTMSVRFRNKTNAPLALGYVAGSGTLVDNFGNRYVPGNPDDVRGMGKVDANKADPQFTLQPGETRAATFIQSRAIREPNKPMGETFTFTLSIAQLEVLYNGQQIRTTREHSLTFAEWPLAAGTASPASSSTPPAPNVPPVVSQGDACAGRARCYDAGSFVAEIVQTTPSIVKATYPWHVVEMNVRFTNKSNQPVVLAYASKSGHLTDNFSNSYVPGNPQDVKGMGVVVAGRADPQFVLRPGESRAATFIQSRAISEANKPMGVDYTYVMTIAELAVLYNGQQIQTVRENSLTFTGITMGGAAAAGSGAAPAGTNDTTENIKKATDAIKGIFGGRKK